jgi:hypothetical protein
MCNIMKKSKNVNVKQMRDSGELYTILNKLVNNIG